MPTSVTINSQLAHANMAIHTDFFIWIYTHSAISTSNPGHISMNHTLSQYAIRLGISPTPWDGKTFSTKGEWIMEIALRRIGIQGIFPWFQWCGCHMTPHVIVFCRGTLRSSAQTLHTNRPRYYQCEGMTHFLPALNAPSDFLGLRTDSRQAIQAAGMEIICTPVIN